MQSTEPLAPAAVCLNRMHESV